MEWLAILFGGSGWLAFGIMALRVSGIKRDRDKADLSRAAQATELKKVADAHADHQKRSAERMENLRNAILELENDLDKCSTPESRRAVLERLLQKTDSASTDAGDSVR